MTQQRNSGPLHIQQGVIIPARLRAALADERRRTEEDRRQKELEALCVAPTQITEALQPLKRVEIPRLTLPLDELGRPFLKMVNSDARTLDLIEEAVEQFHRLTWAYPTVILLSGLRFLEVYSNKHYFPLNGPPIPYDYEQNCELDTQYDVLVRGEALFDGR